MKHAHLLRRALFVLCCLMEAAPLHSIAAADRCAAPEEMTANVAPLPHVAGALKPGGTLDVLTVGSATVFSPDETLKPGTITGQALGLGAISHTSELPMPSDSAFPLQMAHFIKVADPNVTINVTVRGGRGMTATEMVEIIRRELASHRYQLVIWQTGTVEAVHNVDAGDFYRTLQDGAAAIASAGADLVLVNPQFSRFLHANVDLEPYSQSMEQVAALPGAMLFPRFELMHYWVNEGQIDLERTPKADRLSTVEALHVCLGQHLAGMMLEAAHQAS